MTATATLDQYQSQDQDEEARLAVLAGFGVLDTEPEAEFDDLVALAAELCQTPMARVSLVDRDRQWLFARVGPAETESPLETSICKFALTSPDILLIPDTLLDERVADNPVVVAGPRYRFYAGVPLRAEDGYTLGSLCVLDSRPRDLSARQLHQLRLLGRQVMSQLNRRKQAHQLAAEVVARRRAESLASEKQRLLDGIFRHTDAMIYAKDLDGKFLFGNDALADVLQLAEAAPPVTQAVIGRRDDDRFPATADNYRHNDQKVADTGRAQIFREHIRFPNGSVRDYLSNKFPLYDEDGRVYGVAGVSTDVTELTEERRRHAVAESRWHQLFAASPVGIALSDETGCWIAVNPAFCALTGCSEEELIGRGADLIIHPDHSGEMPDMGELIRRADDGVLRQQVKIVRRSGEERWIWATMTHVVGPQGQEHTLAHCLDVTDRVIAELQQKQTEADLSAVARVTHKIQSGADARQTIVDAVAELAQASYVFLLEPRMADRRGGLVLATSATTNPEMADVTIPLTEPSVSGQVSLTGLEKFVPDTAESDEVSRRLLALTGIRTLYLLPIRSLRDGPTGVLAAGWSEPFSSLDDRRTEVVRLLGDQAAVALRQGALMGELESLALTDELTSLPNRRYWDQTLRAMMDKAAEQRSPLTIALADLDRFKQYNDTFGHAAGDLHLRSFGANSVAALRIGDVIARWGGEEFAVALPDCPGANADAVLNRIRMSVPNGQTCSIGYATWNREETADELVCRADRALYRAKATGRDRACADSGHAAPPADGLT